MNHFLLFSLLFFVLSPAAHSQEITGDNVLNGKQSESGIVKFAVPDAAFDQILLNSKALPIPTLKDILGHTTSANKKAEAGRALIFGDTQFGQKQMGFDLVKSIAQSNADAAVTLGLAYERGIAVTSDATLAFDSYSKAADLNDPVGQWAVGRAYQNGIGVQKNYLQANKWIRAAYQNGNKDAGIDLAQSLQFGIGTNRDVSASNDVWKDVILTQKPEAYAGYANFLLGTLNDDNKVQNTKLAWEMIVAAADAGDSQSLSLAYDVSEQRKDEPGKALWANKLIESAARGDAKSAAKLGDIYYATDVKSEDFKRSIQFYEKASVGGNAYASARLGEIIFDNPSVMPSISKEDALTLIDQAATKGDPYAFTVKSNFALKANSPEQAYAFATVASELSGGKYKKIIADVTLSVCAQQLVTSCEPVPVFYFTNRRKAINNSSFTFENRLSDNGEISFGLSKVYIPTKKEANTERKSNFQLAREFAYGALFGKSPDLPNANPQVIQNEDFNLNLIDFIRQIHAVANKQDRKKVFIFVHGFNNSFDDAVRRIAGLSEEYKYPGVPIVLSWASAATSTINTDETLGFTGIGYNNDLQTVASSCTDFRKVLAAIVKEFGSDNVMVLAHSMGGRLLSSMLTTCEMEPGVNTESVKVDKLIFAAPDVLADDFKKVMAVLKKQSNSVTLYVAANDAALRLSQEITGNRRRAGQGGVDRILSADISTIDSTSVELTNSANHAYVFEVPQVKEDLYELLKGEVNPNNRRCPAESIDTKTSIHFWQMQPGCIQ